MHLIVTVCAAVEDVIAYADLRILGSNQDVVRAA